MIKPFVAKGLVDLLALQLPLSTTLGTTLGHELVLRQLSFGMTIMLRVSSHLTLISRRRRRLAHGLAKDARTHC